LGKSVDVSRMLFFWSVDLLRRKTAECLEKNLAVQNARQHSGGQGLSR
jgi:hypothetical protein